MAELRKALILLLILCFTVVSISKIWAVEEPTVDEQILIGIDESDKIQRNGNVYTLTDDINGQLIVGTGFPNTVIDGAGYTLQGNGKGYGVMIRQNNVTVKNLNVENFLVGITFFGIEHPNQLMPYNQKILNNNITTVDTDDATQRDYTGFGIYAEYASNSVISGNTITTPNPEKGIYLGRGCYNNSLINNKLIGCGLNLYHAGDNNILNNTIDGKPIFQFNNVSNQIIDGGAEQVLLFNCTNMTIKNIHPSANYRYAIHLDKTRNSEVTDCEGRVFLVDSDNNIIRNNVPKTIELEGSNYNQIFENTITDAGVCITLKSCKYNDIYGNILSNSSTGIQFDYPGNCQYNNIYMNIIVRVSVGIKSVSSSKNSIYDNNIADCNSGISLSGSDQNRVFQNNIVKCKYAISIRGNDNAIYHNNLVKNEHQVSIQHTYLFSSNIIMAYSTNNTFDLGYPSGGNFWSDYNGTDNDGDGVGDTPYSINENNTDNYPLIAPVDITPLETTPPVISFVSPEDKAYPVNHVPLNFTVNEETLWVCYSLNDQANVTTFENVTLTELSDGTYRLTFYAKDLFGNVGFSSINFTVDTISPNILILSAENKTYTTKVPLTITVDESVSWMAYSLDGQANVTFTGNTTLTGLSEGQHNLTIYAKDSAENTGISETVYFSVTQKAEPFPITWIATIIVTIAVVGVAVLVYLKKIKNK
jgi:parallel beta-helix repeat protein